MSSSDILWGLGFMACYVGILFGWATAATWSAEAEEARNR